MDARIKSGHDVKKEMHHGGTEKHGEVILFSVLLFFLRVSVVNLL